MCILGGWITHPGKVNDVLQDHPFTLQVVALEVGALPEAAYRTLFAPAPVSAWLDSSSAFRGQGRFSILAMPSESQGEVITYDVTTRRVTVARPDGRRLACYHRSLFEYLSQGLEQRALCHAGGWPFDFALGYVGYLGYELKADCGGKPIHRSRHPDACLLFCDRGYVYDAATGRAWLLALAQGPSDQEALRWLDQARVTLAGLQTGADGGPEAPGWEAEGAPRAMALRHCEQGYLRRIELCLDAIARGETYEVCLTNRVMVPFEGAALETYQRLRQVNPAPYAALLQLPGLSVLSSSPERFLRIDRRGVVESKPIKGTAPRSLDAEEDAALAFQLRTSDKERSENVMIVDLVRNDLGRVCEVGSVEVPHLFDVESFETVHQLVSTVRGRLSPDASVVDCVRACFPGGSMTGAPKVRTMDILDALEGSARGVYSGALGYFSLSGSVDLSMVIRTIVLASGMAEVGMGGAIVASSDPAAEFSETQLKAEALLRVLAEPAAAVRAVASTSERRGP